MLRRSMKVEKNVWMKCRLITPIILLCPQNALLVARCWPAKLDTPEIKSLCVQVTSLWARFSFWGRKRTLGLSEPFTEGSLDAIGRLRFTLEHPKTCQNPLFMVLSTVELSLFFSWKGCIDKMMLIRRKRCST